jgi:hypothetical protein
MLRCAIFIEDFKLHGAKSMNILSIKKGRNCIVRAKVKNI